ncbi:MAG: ankyrin repeat domain-containing protein [Mucilaginibacter sp.]|nr:ankyrin repeat domain-containing protein [Mucilaginibacter sp.]
MRKQRNILCKIYLVMCLSMCLYQLKAQDKGNNGLADFPANLQTIVKADDAIALGKLATKEKVNECYGNYSLLSQAVRAGATKCFELLVASGANVNQASNGYVPPFMHAVKYGKLDMVKVLIAKGADKNYVYEGDDPNISDMMPLTYAENSNKQR